jgi:RNA polymerase sigma-70 factor (ECF subfamily)
VGELTSGDALAAVFRAEHGRVLGRLIGLLGEFDLAEEALAEAYSIAAARWSRDGVPAFPAAWLVTTARRRAVDRIRRQRVHTARLPAVAEALAAGHAGDEEVTMSVPDERLQLFFTCCHPALSRASRAALTLRCLAGLSTAEVARLFLTAEATIAQRISRAKAKIRHARIPYRVPDRDELPDRLPAVLDVLYLLFTEGYVATGGARLIRDELCDEAIRLARVLHVLMPDEPEVTGLLALMLLIDARRPARRGPDGALVLLADQDRSRYDHRLISEGRHVLSRALRTGPAGPYAIQAAIAAVHAGAPTAADTDWAQIAGLYRLLRAVAPSPMAALNHAIAVAEADGPLAGLQLLDRAAAAGELPPSHLVPAARAELLRQLGRHREAAAAYTEAIDRAANAVERAHLLQRRGQLTGAPDRHHPPEDQK